MGFPGWDETKPGSNSGYDGSPDNPSAYRATPTDPTSHGSMPFSPDATQPAHNVNPAWSGEGAGPFIGSSTSTQVEGYNFQPTTTSATYSEPTSTRSTSGPSGSPV